MNPKGPKRLKWWLITIGVVYLVFPRDLIPDFLGRGLGLIDDLLVIALLSYFYRRQLGEAAARGARGAGGRERHEDSARCSAAAHESSPDPYQVLGITSSASTKAIHAAYKARMSEYHPDKVAHLGEDLQKLAHRKALEIQHAYQQLCE